MWVTETDLSAPPPDGEITFNSKKINLTGTKGLNIYGIHIAQRMEFEKAINDVACRFKGYAKKITLIGKDVNRDFQYSELGHLHKLLNH
ncbi:MAG: hypothetical protein QW176_00530 [Candidatus Bathyarchaeia archaeon]